MSKINLLVTGLAISKEECLPCNFEYSWIFKHPSTLLWADKIIITPYMEEVIETASFPDKNGPLSRAIKLIFELANSYDLIEVKDPANIINSNMADKIEEEILMEMEVLSELFPDNVKMDSNKDNPVNISIGGKEYCFPVLWSIYANLILSKKWNAESLFSEHMLNFLKYKFGSSLINDKDVNNLPKSFDTIFNSHIPEFNYPQYIYSQMPGSPCFACAHTIKCDNSYLTDLEQNLSRYLDLRDYVAVNQLKKTIYDIKKSLKSKNKPSQPENIIDMYKVKEREISKNMYSTFPKVKKWADISLMVSVPVTIVAAYTGLPTVSALGATISGVSTIVDKYIEHLENKYSWVGFKIN